MPRLFQIYEDDLTALGDALPDICEGSKAEPDTILLVKQILSNVRWNYQPHTDHKIIKPDEE